MQLTIHEEKVTPLIRKVVYPLAETMAGIRNSPVPGFYADLLAGDNDK